MSGPIATVPGPSRVTVFVPYWGERRRVVEAVRSILRQGRLVGTVVIVSDGDAAIPSDRLRRLDPHRVVTFVLPENRGHFFVREVAWRAALDDWVAFVDADDRVRPRWLERLAEAATTGGGVAFGATRLVRSYGPIDRAFKTRPVDTARAGSADPRHFATHNGLYRRDRIDAVGGFDPSFRIAYDTVFVNLIALSGPFGAVEEPLYVYRKSDAFAARKPLTGGRSTGFRSSERERATARALAIYREARPAFATDAAHARAVVLAGRDPLLAAEVEERSNELREALRELRGSKESC